MVLNDTEWFIGKKEKWIKKSKNYLFLPLFPLLSAIFKPNKKKRKNNNILYIFQLFIKPLA